MSPALPIVAITMGDPGGIGPEIIAKALRQQQSPRNFHCLVIGSSNVFQELSRRLKLELPLNPVPTLDRSFFRQNAVNFLDVQEQADWLVKQIHKKQRVSGEKIKNFEPGKVSLTNAALAYSAVKIAAYEGASGVLDAVVTAPVNKTSMRLVDRHFDGHTEYLAKVARAPEFAMMFVSEKLKVTLVTIHVPLGKVSRLITEELVLAKIRLTDAFLRTRLKIANPKIGVCALNPHGSETGQEEEKVLVPAVKKARAQKINAEGPFSADQLFFDAYEGRYDALISMYHDQALGPFKMIAFRDGVNVTLGLPYVRTSPDHGTAFDIAWQGKADPQSMQSALSLVEKLIAK